MLTSSDEREAKKRFEQFEEIKKQMKDECDAGRIHSETKIKKSEDDADP